MENHTKTHEKQVIAITATCHGVVHILELSYGAVLLSIGKEFGVSFAILGLLANILGFTFGLSALPFGILADRIDPRKLLILCCLGMSVSAVAIGLAPNIYLVGVALMFLGLVMGIYHPTGASYISRNVTKSSLGFGLQGVGGNLGVALGPLLAGQIAFLLNWRAAYLIFSVPPLILAIAIFLARNNRGLETPGINGTKAETKAEKESLKAYLLPLGLIFSTQVMLNLVYRGMVTFMPAYLSQNVASLFPTVNKQLIAGYVTTFILIFGVGGQFLGGLLCQRMRHEVVAMAINLIGVPLLIMIGNSSGGLLIFIASIFAFFHFMGQPVYNTLVADYSPSSRRGTVFGSYFFFNFGLGSFSATILGLVADHMGLNWVFIVSSVFGLVAVFLISGLLFRRSVIKKK